MYRLINIFTCIKNLQVYDLPEKKKPARKTAAKTTKKQEKKETLRTAGGRYEVAAKAAADGAKEPEIVEVKKSF